MLRIQMKQNINMLLKKQREDLKTIKRFKPR